MTERERVASIYGLGMLAEAPGREQARLARELGLPVPPDRAAYTDLFVVQLYPYASVYLSEDGRLGGAVQRQVADFWRVLGQPVPSDPDHIATLLSTYGHLVKGAGADADPRVRGTLAELRPPFLWEHLVSWLVPYLLRVRELGSASYAAWGAQLLDLLESEAVLAGPPTALPLALRAAPPVNGGAPAFADTLFAPARSGVILTRADLYRCAHDLLLPVRVADRRYTLESLLTQDPARVADWLAGEAVRQADTLRQTSPVFDVVTAHWEQRARTTGARLAEIAHMRAPMPPSAG